MTSPFDDYRKLIRSYPKLLEIEEGYLESVNAHLGAANGVIKEFNKEVENYYRDLTRAGSAIAAQLPPREESDWLVLAGLLNERGARMSLADIDDVINFEAELPHLDEVEEVDCGPLHPEVPVLNGPGVATLDKLEDALKAFEQRASSEAAVGDPPESLNPPAGSSSTVRDLFKRSLQEYADARAALAAHQQKELEERAKKHAADVARDVALHENGQISTGELERRIACATREYFLTPTEDVERDLSAMRAAKQLLDAETAARAAGVVETPADPVFEHRAALEAKLKHLSDALEDLRLEVYGQRR